MVCGTLCVDESGAFVYEQLFAGVELQEVRALLTFDGGVGRFDRHT